MEFINNPRNPNPRQSTGAVPGRPLDRRTFNDFGPRPARPMQQPGTRPVPQPRLQQPAAPQPSMAPRPPMPGSQPPQPHHPHQTHQPHSPHHPAADQQPRPVNPAPTSALRPVDLPRVPVGDPAHDDKMHKPNHHNTHAGIVGLVCFVLLAGLLLSPLLPGKILNNFPGNSQSESSGEETFACATDLKNATSSQAYTLKLGAPIVYKYTLVTTEKAQCGNKAQSVDSGRSSQFNPLGLLADLVLVLVVSVGIAKLWGFIASRSKS